MAARDKYHEVIKQALIKKSYKMDKVIKYKKMVKRIIEQIIEREESYNPPIDYVFIKDEKQGHYLVFLDGCVDNTVVYNLVIHVEVKKNGRVWLKHDGTEYEVGQLLLDNGLPKSDLVVGWLSPLERSWTDFAVA